MIMKILAFGGLALGVALVNIDISTLNYVTIMSLYCLNMIVLGIILEKRGSK